jgi:two-component system, OmpR family, alkaline phosphatase synthesis response regulator PhoP
MARARRILVVDDEPGIGPLVSMCLENLEVEVLAASGLEDTLDKAQEAAVGLVLLDLALGEEDGLEILPRLRADPALRDVPIVAFTAHDSRRAEALEVGVDSFLARPFSTVELQSTVQRYVGDGT